MKYTYKSKTYKLKNKLKIFLTILLAVLISTTGYLLSRDAYSSSNNNGVLTIEVGSRTALFRVSVYDVPMADVEIYDSSILLGITNAEGILELAENSYAAPSYIKIGDETINLTEVIQGEKYVFGYEMELPGEAYAEFDSSNGQLRIFRDGIGAYTDNQVIGTKTYYTGIETVTGSTYPKWYSNNINITNVIIEDYFKPLTTTNMFDGCNNLVNITGLSKMITNQVQDMHSMFCGCSSLTSLDLSSFNTSNVTNIFYMFQGCSSLTELDLSSFNTSNVTDVSSMFRNCTNLRTVNLSSFNTNNIFNFSCMFQNCISLTSLDLSNFTVTNNSMTSSMFDRCTNLYTLKLGINWQFRDSTFLSGSWQKDGDATVYTANQLESSYNGSTMAGTYRRLPDGEAFAEFDSATGTLRIFRDNSGIYTNNQTIGTKIYYTGIETITGTMYPKWDSNRENITNVVIEDYFRPKTAYCMFFNCEGLANITGIEYLDTSNVTNMYNMFGGCSGLTTLDVSGFDTSNVVNMCQMFIECSGLTSLDVSSFNTNNVTTMQSMFWECTNLTSLDLSNFNTSKVTDMHYMFDTCMNLINLDVSSFDTSNVVDTSYMFFGCTKLTNLDVSNFNTSKVTSMYDMFSYCMCLTSLDVSSFDTSNVTNMGNMFSNCTNLVSLDLSNFNTNKVTKIYDMFENCSNLINLNINSFNTNNVTDMSYVFSGCSSLTTLDISSFNTANVTTMKEMFENCSSLTNLDLSGFDTSNVTNMLNMFQNMTQLNTLKLGTNWNFLANNGLANSWQRDGDTIVYTASQLINSYNGATMAGTYRVVPEAYAEFDSATGILRIFRDNPGSYTDNQVIDTKTYYTGIETITGNANPKWYSKRSNITSVVIEDEFKPQTAYYMFADCNHLKAITGIENLDTSDVTSMQGMFYECSGLATLNVSSFNTSNVTDMGRMFYNCNYLSNVDVSNFDTSKVTSMSEMFYSCQNLTNIDVSNFDTRQVKSMFEMFYLCTNLISLDVSNWNTNNVTIIKRMFRGCESLINLDVSNFSTSKVTDMVDMFYDCNSLTSLDVSNFDTSNVTDIESMFRNCSSLTTLNISNFNTINVTSMSYMFCGCDNLKSLNLANFDTSSVKFAHAMFADCSNLASIDLSSFDTSNTIGMDDIFDNTPKLNTLKLGTNWNFLANNGLTGSWQRDGDTTVYTAAELTTNYNGSTMAGTYRWPKVGYAEFDSSTGILRFFRDDEGLYTDLQVVGNKTYYADFENLGINQAPAWLGKSQQIRKIIFDDEIKPINTYVWFRDMEQLTEIINIEYLNTSNCTKMELMFSNCKSLTNLDLSSFDTSKVTTMESMFAGCNNLTTLDLSNFDTSEVTSLYYMFGGCEKLKVIDLSHFDTSKVETMMPMFYNVKAEYINISNFDFSHVSSENISGFFVVGYANEIVADNVKFSVDNSAFFASTSIQNISIKNPIFMPNSSITSFFSGTRLETLDLSTWDTSDVTSMNGMFSGMDRLHILKLGANIDFINDPNLSKKWVRDGDTTIYTGAELTNSYDGSTMAGTYRALQQLTITEQVKGSLADINKNFNFTIYVSVDAVGINATYAYTGSKSGNLVFNNGNATFSLKHGESISADLPYGYYSITQNSDGYTLSSSNSSGTLSSDKTATFTDTLDGSTPTGIFLDLIPFIVLIVFGVFGIFLIRKFKYI